MQVILLTIIELEWNSKNHDSPQNWAVFEM